MERKIKEVKKESRRKPSKDIKILGGGILNYCDRTNREYIKFLTSLNEKDEGYKLLNTSIDNIVEFYRVCLHRSFGDTCELPYKIASLEELVDSCIRSIKPIIEDVKRYDALGEDRYLFIQGCLNIMVKLRNKIKG